MLPISPRRTQVSLSRTGLRVRAEEAAAEAKAAPKAAAKAAPKAKKKAKAPEKPLPEAMAEDIIPQLQKTLEEEGVEHIKLLFVDNQLRGSFMNNNIPYNFWAYFPDGSLTGQRGWSMSSHGYPPSTVEPFIIDEKRITSEVVVFWVTKRLAAQKSNLPSLD